MEHDEFGIWNVGHRKLEKRSNLQISVDRLYTGDQGQMSGSCTIEEEE
jgi:hypothetical protein